jgi:hypothetical protein
MRNRHHHTLRTDGGKDGKVDHTGNLENRSPFSWEELRPPSVVLFRSKTNGHEGGLPNLKGEMNMLARWLKFGVAALVVAAGLWTGGTAKASDPYYTPTYNYKKVVSYETYTSYETRSESYQVTVVKYDSYGCPYNVYETRYRYYQVPVYKTVPVTKYVKVPTYNYNYSYGYGY